MATFKVRNGLVFHSQDERGVPVIYHAGDLVEFEGDKPPAQLEKVIEAPKPKAKGKD